MGYGERLCYAVIATLIFLVVFSGTMAHVSSRQQTKSDAQIVCELSHSADVCFQALNR